MTYPVCSVGETLRYAAELYDVAASDEIDGVVDSVITKMGLASCVDTRNASLSGGQRRRLSIGIALLKQPTLLFLDEPTSGLVSRNYFTHCSRFEPTSWIGLSRANTFVSILSPGCCIGV